MKILSKYVNYGIIFTEYIRKEVKNEEVRRNNKRSYKHKNESIYICFNFISTWIYNGICNDKTSVEIC